MDQRRDHLDRLPASGLDRRRFLLAGGSLAGLLALSQLSGEEALAAPSLGAYPFTLGVASGDPWPDGFVIWTRLAPDPLHGGGMPNRQIPVEWRVATDAGMQQVVRRGTQMAGAPLAHSVHVELRGLEPGRDYYYQFSYRDDESPIGRARTTPAKGAHLDRLRFAFASCQKWEDGYYSAFRRMAEEDLDLVVHLGDYIYEYGIANGSGPRKPNLPAAFRAETVTLEQFRLRHALYKTDPDLQAAHARFPWVVTWDDHEVDNDYTDDIPEDGMPRPRFLARRIAAYQAFYEHQPLRWANKFWGEEMRLYRRLTYGDLVEMSVLDTRQYRSDQPCGDGEFPRCAGSADPQQTMTGPLQERWLLDGLGRSGARWNVIAQQVLMAELKHTNPERYWQDSWDGYPLARQRILNYLHQHKVANPIVITGDWHSTFVSDLKLDFKDQRSPIVASEFAGTSISSNGDGIVYGPYYGPFIPANPHITFFDGDRRGYVRVDLTPQRWRTDLRMVTSVSTPDAPAYTFASFAVDNGRRGVQRV